MAGPGPSAPRTLSVGGRGLGIASLVLGVLGLGIPAVVVGVLALARRRPGRGIALAGIVLGVLGTAALVLVVLAAAGRSREAEALRQEWISPGQVPAFVAAASGELDRLKQQADRKRAALGVLGAQELAPVEELFERIRADLEAMKQSVDEDEVNELRVEVLAKLEQSRSMLGSF